jgi:hypothetical protein
LAVLAVVGFAVPSFAALPGTLNFENQSSAITSTVPEISSNEKEVDLGDYDNDGDLDVVVGVGMSDFGTRRNKLYRNTGGTFQEVSGAPVIPAFSTPDVTRNAFFRDYDDDGFLDIIVVNDNNTGGDGGRTKYYRGTGTTFIEEGIARLGSSSGGAACGGVSVDQDGDGDEDLYVGNYPGPSQDFMSFNNGNGFFTPQPVGTMIPSDSDYTVDVSAADVNNDGKIDIIRSSWNADVISYNNIGDQGSDGDLAYPGSTQSLPAASTNEHAQEPIDVDNDGDMDIYATSFSGAQDRIRLNTGNLPNGHVNWTIIGDSGELPEKVTSGNVGVKATVMDLNGDGRTDIFRTGSLNSAAILRNATVDGDILFINWTPDSVDEAGVHGWHGAAGDVAGDERPDIFYGAWVGERLYTQVDTDTFDETGASDFGITAVGSPVAVLGSSTDADTVDEYTVDVPTGRRLSVVLTSAGDYELEVLSGASVLASSDRGGINTEEALEIGNTGSLTIRVTMIDGGAGDSDGDGDVDLNDFNRFQLCFSGPNNHYDYGCLSHDMDADGDVDLADFGDFSLGFGQPVTTGQYQLEVLVH